MVNKMMIAIVSSIAATAALGVAQVYVPENFEKPTFFRISASITRLIAFGVRLAARLNFGTEAALLRKLTPSKKKINENESPVLTEDRIINGINVRIYRPRGDFKQRLPLVVFYHGGAYFLGSVDSYDGFVRKLTEKIGSLVVSVDYRLSPEHPYPIPANDCFSVTKYLLENPDEFNFDLNRVALMGDSAGGHVVAVTTQRLLRENLQQPKLQILVYPRVGYYSYQFPSNIFYSGKDFLSHLGLSGGKTYLWHVGITNFTSELENAILSNKHTLLIEDAGLRKKYESYLDIKYIPDEYKSGKTYYIGYTSEKMQKLVFPHQLDEKSVFKRDKNIANTVKQLLTPEASPLLADDEVLKQLPKAYFAVVEWDAIKDQSLIYAGRLKHNGVPVEIAFFENGFHGIMNYIDESVGYKVAHEIMDGIVSFIKANL